jgi:hypothetical protein
MDYKFRKTKKLKNKKIFLLYPNLVNLVVFFTIKHFLQIL